MAKCFTGIAKLQVIIVEGAYKRFSVEKSAAPFMEGKENFRMAGLTS